MPYLELTINCAICTGRGMPAVVNSKQRYVEYLEYDSDAALLLPVSARSGINQAFALEELLRQLANFLKCTTIPSFYQPHKKPCKSLEKLGFHVRVAGIPRRPLMPFYERTMGAVWDYLQTLKGR